MLSTHDKLSKYSLQFCTLLHVFRLKLLNAIRVWYCLYIFYLVNVELMFSTLTRLIGEWDSHIHTLTMGSISAFLDFLHFFFFQLHQIGTINHEMYANLSSCSEKKQVIFPGWLNEKIIETNNKIPFNQEPVHKTLY